MISTIFEVQSSSNQVLNNPSVGPVAFIIYYILVAVYLVPSLVFFFVVSDKIIKGLIFIAIFSVLIPSIVLAYFLSLLSGISS